MKIIGITGTNGSGKGTVADFLVSEFGCIHRKAREIILEFAEKEGVQIINRESMNAYTEKKSKDGWNVFGAFIEEHKNEDKIFILESIRRVSEINLIKSLTNNFIMLGVDAPLEVRFERVKGRGEITDRVDMETFIRDEKRESESFIDTEMNINRCMQSADAVLINDGDLDKLKFDVQNLKNKFSNFF